MTREQLIALLGSAVPAASSAAKAKTGLASARARARSGTARDMQESIEAMVLRMKLTTIMAVVVPNEIELGGEPTEVAAMLLACAPVARFKVVEILQYPDDPNFATARIKVTP